MTQSARLIIKNALVAGTLMGVAVFACMSRSGCNLPLFHVHLSLDWNVVRRGSMQSFDEARPSAAVVSKGERSP